MKRIISTVSSVATRNSDVQVVTLDPPSKHPAICYTRLVGEVSPGDIVAVNTTATDLDLGTGGYDFVICKLDGKGAIEDDPSDPDGHIMKLRYTPLQRDVQCVEEVGSPFHDLLRNVNDLLEMPVVCCGLHSQVPLVAAGIRAVFPSASIVYCMTDEAALLAWFSNIVEQSIATGLVNLCITCGQAMGGNAEAVSLHSGLLASKYAFGADVAIVSMGPGIPGTGTAFGHGGVSVAESVNAAAALGGTPIAVIRASQADSRDRHHGVSHHFLEAMGRLALARAKIFMPSEIDGDIAATVNRQLRDSGILEKHEAISVDDREIELDMRGMKVTTMGRGPEEDPLFFRMAACAGIGAGRLALEMRSEEVAKAEESPDGDGPVNLMEPRMSACSSGGSSLDDPASPGKSDENGGN
ncbi:MAG: DUF3866 family protein [Coriobacteriales bacterium]